MGKENDFSSVPETLLNVFGQPVFVMKVLLDGRRKFVVGTAQEIEERINQDGFFVQMLNDEDFNVVGKHSH